MRGPSPDELVTETARLAHRFHWSLDTILDLEHRDRKRFLAASDAVMDSAQEATWTSV